MKLPISLLKGAALREAAATDLQDIMRLVRTACAKYYAPTDYERIYIQVEAISATHVVCVRNDRYYRHSYMLGTNNEVTLGSPEEVNKEFLPVSVAVLTEAAPISVNGSNCFIEAKDESGRVWEIRIINAGKSKNNTLYPEVLLRESASKFEGARVFQKPDEEHIKGKGKDFKNLIGRLSNPRFIEASSDMPAGINAEFHVLQSAGDTASKIKELYDRGMTDVFGFSIDVGGVAKAGKGFREAVSITAIHSVDLIIEPGAGGRLIQLIEAAPQDSEPTTTETEQEYTMKLKMIEAVKAANGGALPADLDTSNEDALMAAYREAVAPKELAQAVDIAGEVSKLVNGEMALREARMNARLSIGESSLPAKAKERLVTRFTEASDFTADDVTKAIKEEADYLATFTESGKVADSYNSTRITEDQADRASQMLNAFFDPSDRSVVSIREAYAQLTGDTRVTGLIKNFDEQRFAEAAGVDTISTTTFADVLGNAINRAMINTYQNQAQYSNWREIADVVPLNDFRAQERYGWGGYGNLPIVGEGDDYLELNLNAPTKAEYSAQKRGGIETITLEAIKNDNVGLVRSIPNKMAMSAARTLNKFVFDFLYTNPVIFDTKALFHADHKNTGTDLLSLTALKTGRNKMIAQTEGGSGALLGLTPRHLVVPMMMEADAFDLFKLGQNNDKTFIQSQTLNIIPVPYWSGNKWYLVADKNESAFIEIGFMDGNENPEIFIQDQPTVGSVFTNDIITYKIRHIYGGAVLDYRAAYGSLAP